MFIGMSDKLPAALFTLVHLFSGGVKSIFDYLLRLTTQFCSGLPNLYPDNDIDTLTAMFFKHIRRSFSHLQFDA